MQIHVAKCRFRRLKASRYPKSRSAIKSCLNLVFWHIGIELDAINTEANISSMTSIVTRSGGWGALRTAVEGEPKAEDT